MPGIDADPVRKLTELAADLSARKLVDRNREGSLRLTALAAAEGMSQPSMTRLVQRLERQGLVQRLGYPCENRVALLSLTDSIVQSRFAGEGVATIP
jgi:DNA-binding HxlR family transcriptional regulator